MKNWKSLTSIVLALTSVSTLAENWGQWRGPTFNGSTSEKKLPVKFSKSENVAWSLDLPGPSAATPVIWNDRVFVSSTDKTAQKLLALCVNRTTGKVLWNQAVADGFRRDRQSNFASPSPATDGQRVIFFFATGDLVAFDMAGKKLWERNIQKDYGEFAFLWTFSTSPVLYDGKLFMQVFQRDVAVDGRGQKNGPNDSYLLALDPANGKELWRQVRPSEAVSESREAFTTPVPYEFKGRKELLAVGGDCLTAHDPKTGKELWRWGTWNPSKIGHWRLVPSPVAGDGVVLACAPKSEPIFAIKADGKGLLQPSDIAWTSDKKVLTSDVPTPAFHDGDFFILSDVRKNISRVEAKTGNIKWTCALPGRSKFEASPSLGADKIYAMNFAGDVVVVDAKKGEVLLQTPMGETGDDTTRSCIALAQGHAFIRTNSKLFCVGNK
jgi:outer membrane protein assembly factor BamB